MRAPLGAMRLLVVSHKPCWRAAGVPGGVVTDGGFPMQMRALAALFADTRIAVPVAGATTGGGHVPLAPVADMSVVPLAPPGGRGIGRKLRFVGWTLRHLPRLVGEMHAADAVHVPIPGDVGTVGILLALALRKPLFVRHCGDWTRPRTRAERAWVWLLEAIAGGRTVVLATGGTAAPPSRRAPAVRWIFSTSLDEAALARLAARPRRASDADAPRLLIACRQDEAKGTGIVLDALPAIRAALPGVTLDVIGDGPALDAFRTRATRLGVADAVRFHGKCTQAAVVEAMRDADLFCYPTRASEGFPKVVLEAMAAGLPVVTTPVSVLAQLVTPDVGVLLDEAAAAPLADAVVTLLRAPARRAAMGTAAAARARDFSLERWRDTIRVQLETAWRAPAPGAGHPDRDGQRVVARECA